MTSITINATGDHQYTPEALGRAAMLIEDVLRGGGKPVRIDDLGAQTGKPISMIRAAVTLGIEAGELGMTQGGRVVLMRCKPADTAVKTSKPRRAAK